METDTTRLKEDSFRSRGSWSRPATAAVHAAAAMRPDWGIAAGCPRSIAAAERPLPQKIKEARNALRGAHVDEGAYVAVVDRLTRQRVGKVGGVAYRSGRAASERAAAFDAP
ncbi:hypothetical protein AB0D14_41365 [Streptomyces sp. NPDC048484]|uniref:hypothetical protein n=1 Tax=Streptomyces sp. NPDC048484 TaxID=3155146 RepID=UPI003441C163